jgi:predicted RNA-binding protein
MFSEQEYHPINGMLENVSLVKPIPIKLDPMMIWEELINMDSEIL